VFEKANTIRKWKGNSGNGRRIKLSLFAGDRILSRKASRINLKIIASNS
jgi:hypothetical protein